MSSQDHAGAGPSSEGPAPRVCTLCGTAKQEADFGWRSKAKGTRLAQCKACRAEAARESYRPSVKESRDRIDGSGKTERRCGSCKQWKPLESEYHWANKTLGKRQMSCKSCANATSRAYNKRNPEAKREVWRRYRNDHYLRRTYGLTQQEYDELYERQGRACRICRDPGGDPRANRKPLHVDHDHACCPGRESCGKCVRGLLCKRCNTMLGNARDKVEILEAAIRYLSSANLPPD